MVYQLSMRDDMLPRFTAADMPLKPEPPGTQPAATTAAGSGAATPAANGGDAQKEASPAKAPKK